MLAPGPQRSRRYHGQGGIEDVLLLLDEPFSSLDRDLRITLRGELATLRRQLHFTTIYVTHDPDDAEALADRTVAIRSAKVGAVMPHAH